MKKKVIITVKAEGVSERVLESIQALIAAQFSSAGNVQLPATAAKRMSTQEAFEQSKFDVTCADLSFKVE